MVHSFLAKKESRFQAILYLLGGLAYAYAMLLTYVYGFGHLEGPSLVMYDCYMMTYLFFGILYGFLLICYHPISLSFRFLLVVTIFISIAPSTRQSSLPAWHYEGLYDYHIEHLQCYLDENPDKKILVISQNDVRKRCALRYFVIEHDNRIRYLDIAYAKEGNYDIGEAMWEKEYFDLLKQYDALYIVDYDDSFLPFWKVSKNDELLNDGFYNIHPVDEENIELKMISIK